MNFYIKSFNELSALEYHQILKLRTAIFVVEQNCPYQEVDDKDLQAIFLWAEENGEIAGTLRILPAGLSFPQVAIGRVAVAENFRNRHLARQMMERAIDFIRRRGDKEIAVQAQSYLVKFYGSLGFQITSEEYLEDNIPHRDMLLKLA